MATIGYEFKPAHQETDCYDHQNSPVTAPHSVEFIADNEYEWDNGRKGIVAGSIGETINTSEDWISEFLAKQVIPAGDTFELYKTIAPTTILQAASYFVDCANAEGYELTISIQKVSDGSVVHEIASGLSFAPDSGIDVQLASLPDDIVSTLEEPLRIAFTFTALPTNDDGDGVFATECEPVPCLRFGANVMGFGSCFQREVKGLCGVNGCCDSVTEIPPCTT